MFTIVLYVSITGKYNSFKIDIIHHIPCNVTFHDFILHLFITDLNYIYGHILPTIIFYHNDPMMYFNFIVLIIYDFS